jgi:hypothetical protein
MKNEAIENQQTESEFMADCMEDLVYYEELLAHAEKNGSDNNISVEHIEAAIADLKFVMKIEY